MRKSALSAALLCAFTLGTLALPARAADDKPAPEKKEKAKKKGDKKEEGDKSEKKGGGW